ncbi:hypothetical protein [Poritiphilus flavus]|nr:hypothetical protein [Poritiphilus flavus]
MRMCIFCRKLRLLGVALLLSGTLFAQEKVSKQLEENFDMTDSGKFHLDNKYGDIIINGWDRDAMLVTIDISVSHRKRENAVSLLDRIQPEIKTAGDFVSITSEIREKNQGVIARYFNKANPFSFDKSNIQIDYTIYLPENAELEISNKFGDLIIEDWSGKLNSDVQHGDVWLNRDLNNADVSVSFGKLRAKSINYGNLRLKNGSLDMERSADLRLNTSGSTVKIEAVTKMRLYSSKDEITIEEIGSIDGDIRFTTIYLNQLQNAVDLTLKVTDMRVSEIQGPVVAIDITQESSDINLNISGVSFDFDATLEQGLLRMPKTFRNVDSRVLDSGKRIREINAVYGNNPDGRISIEGKKGIIQLNER